MNTTINFIIQNRHISSDTKSIDLIGDNMDYTAVFDLDEDMASERIKTARFIKDDKQQERILDDNNSCQIPPELLKKGYISVGVYTDEKSTTPCFLQINRSIRETDYPVKDPEPDVYRQLLDKIEKLKGLREIELRADEKNIQWRYVGEEEWQELISFSDITVSPEEIKQAVKEYLKDNPLEETDPTVPDWAKEPQKPTYTAEEVGALPADTNIPTKTSELENDSGYLTEHQDVSGKLDASKLPEAINTALAQAKESGMFDGKDGKDGVPGEKGEPGKTGPRGPKGEAVTDEQIATAVENYIKENPIGGGSGNTGEKFEWEYIGEFTHNNQSTFESGKYRFFYVEAFFTLDGAVNVYPYLCVDGHAYFRWAFSNVSNKILYGLILHGKTIIGYSVNGNTYPNHLNRGNGELHMAKSEPNSIGTAFIVSTDAKHPISTFGIKLWGAK